MIRLIGFRYRFPDAANVHFTWRERGRIFCMEILTQTIDKIGRGIRTEGQDFGLCAGPQKADLDNA